MMDINSESVPPREAVAACVVAVLAALGIIALGILRPATLAYDDAYITYRYADNLRRGLGLVYNPGEWVLGTTSPLYALLLGALNVMIPDLEILAHWVGIASWIAATWFAMALLWQQRHSRAAMVVALLIASDRSLLQALGMETHLLLALMLAVAWAWLGLRRRLVIPLAAALLLTRMDAVFWLLLLGLEAWRRDRVLPWREATGTLLLLSPWLGYAWWRYGSPFPNSALAKMGQNTIMPVANQGSFILALWNSLQSGASGFQILLLVFVVLVGLWAILRRAPNLWWLPAWLVCYGLFYVITRVIISPWYLAPSLVAFSCLAALGIGFVLGDPTSLDHGATRADRGRMVVPLISAIVLILAGWLVTERYMSAYASRKDAGYISSYASIGRWLASHTAEDARVATIEIGVIGYLSSRPILDTMGLVSPEMTEHQVGWIETLAYAINVHRPDYAVVLPGTAWDGIVGQWWFSERYDLQVSFGNAAIYKALPSPVLTTWTVQAEFVDGLSLQGVRYLEDTLTRGSPQELWLDVDVDKTQPGLRLFTLFWLDPETWDRHAIITAEPFDGTYGALKWQPGDRLSIPMRIDVPQQLHAGAYRLGFAVYDPDRQVNLSLRDSDDDGAIVAIGWFRVGDPPDASFAAELTPGMASVEWINGIQLVQTWMPSESVQAGVSLPIGFVWRITKPIERDLTLFVHMLDAEGRILAQQDTAPLGRRWPTTVWRTGETLGASLEMTVPPDTSPGVYDLAIGLYDDSGRVPLARTQSDTWFIQEVIHIVPKP